MACRLSSRRYDRKMFMEPPPEGRANVVAPALVLRSGGPPASARRAACPLVSTSLAGTIGSDLLVFARLAAAHRPLTALPSSTSQLMRGAKAGPTSTPSA